MISRRSGWLLGLGLWLIGLTAQAQRVVVLDFEGDRGGRVRAQVEEALQAAGRVEVIPVERYKKVASLRRLRGARAMTPAAVAEVAPRLNLDAAVSGSVGVTFLVRILSPEGRELWSKALAVTRGGISPETARRLAAAIAVAASPRPPPGSPEPPPPSPEEPMVAPEPPPPPLPPPAPPPVPLGPGPDLVVLRVGGATTWRSYCARPGVTSCAAFDTLSDKPVGETVSYFPGFPYQAVTLGVELFPFAEAHSAFRGLGLSGSYLYGFPHVIYKVRTPSNETPQVNVRATDQLLQAAAAYRVYFPFGPSRLPGYVGARGGVVVRDFTVDPTAEAPIPGDARLHGAVGLEAVLPFFRLLRVRAQAEYFLSPLPGPRERDAYGSPVTSLGAGAELELAGDVLGAWGYSVTGRLHAYGDAFQSGGTRWTSGGVAEEWYATVVWAVTAHF